MSLSQYLMIYLKQFTFVMCRISKRMLDEKNTGKYLILFYCIYKVTTKSLHVTTSPSLLYQVSFSCEGYYLWPLSCKTFLAVILW